MEDRENVKVSNAAVTVIPGEDEVISAIS